MALRSVVLSLALITTPALAQVPATPGAPTTAAAGAVADPGDQRVCKTQTATGSRLGRKRVCMTRREWAQRAKEDQKAIGDYISSQTSASGQ